MCCSLRPAKLTNTILYAAESLHQGRLVHVMGYQNRAKNLWKGPNAMLLPIPAEAPMGPDNMLDTTLAKGILKDYADAVRKHYSRYSRGLSKSMTYGGARRSVQVFDKGSYTIALAENARDIPTALDRIPENRRPEMNQNIFKAYDTMYPGWKMALCAWDGTIDAEPLLWWYEPKDPSRLFMPALDAHDGMPPKLATTVAIDHTLVVGSVVGALPDGADVLFHDTIPDALKPFLATKVAGIEYTDGSSLKNGDFSCRMANLGKGIIDRIPPPVSV